MNCINHAAAPAVGTCAGCAEGFCRMCLITVQGQQWCRSCKSVAGGNVLAGQGPIGEAPGANAALWFAILGFFCWIILEPIAISKALAVKRAVAANPRLTGGGKATAAIIIACIVIALGILGTIARLSTMK